MASASATSDIIKQLSELTQCSICTDTQSDPRQLPCVHTYCLQCIKGVCRDKMPGDQVPCPICRQEFTIPLQGGVESLPKNFFVEQMKDLVKAPTAHCEVCSMKKTASRYCVECNENMCEACADIHGRLKVSKAHKVVAMADANKYVETKVHCTVHQDKVLQSFCFDCKAAICVTCSSGKHKTHRRADVDGVAAELRKQMTDDIKSLSGTIIRCREMMKEGKNSKVELRKKFDAVEKQICDRVEQIKAQIEREKADLLKELVSYRTESDKKIDHVIAELEQHVSFVESLVAYTEQVRDKGTPCDVAQQSSTLHIRASELSNLHDKQQAVGTSPMDVTFTASLWPLSSSGRVIGSIRNQVEEVKEVKAELIHSLDEGNAIYGLTTLKNQLFVDYGGDRHLTVYDTETYRVQRKVTLTGVCGVADMTSCKIHECVYISDHIKNVVHRIMNNDKIIQWPVNDKPRGISVNSVHNVLVTCEEVSKIKEFTFDGNLVRVITLQNDIKNPWHSIQLTPDSYVVCHSNVGDELHRVCIVDSVGHLRQSYGGRKGSGEGQLNVPCRLALSDNIYVSDIINHRVVILSRTLSYIGDVVSGLRYPGTILFDEQTARLYVEDSNYENGKWVSGCVRVYKV